MIISVFSVFFVAIVAVFTVEHCLDPVVKNKSMGSKVYIYDIKLVKLNIFMFKFD